MRRVLGSIVAISTALASGGASAGQLDDVLARLSALEKENTAIRKENAALRENATLREQNARLKAAARAHAAPATGPIVPDHASTSPKSDPFGAYAADLPVGYRAPQPEPPGRFTAWVEGGAIWSGGDPVFRDFTLVDFTTSLPFASVFGFPIPGRFDLTPKVGWDVATGFDYRFADSPWHVNGQFRYGESGKVSGSASSSGLLNPALFPALLPAAAVGTVAGGQETFSATYQETAWLADLGAGYDVARSGGSGLQVTGGLRIQEFVARTNTSDISSTFINFPNPFAFVPGAFIPSVNVNGQTLVDTRASFLGAGPRIGLEGSIPFAGNWSFDYLGDAAVLFGAQSSVSTTTTSSTTTPAFLGGATGTINTSSNRLLAAAFSGDIQVGISYWLTQNIKVGASYRLDALINVWNENSTAASNLTPDRYAHGPRVTISGSFDSL